MHSVQDGYDHLVGRGEIEPDASQLRLVARLDALAERLGEAPLATKHSALGWLFGRAKSKPTFVRGLYIHGAVGRGKSMLMDLFFDRVALKAKRRVHFHDFMADAQERIHRARQEILAGRLADGDPIAPVAADLAGEAKLLCFDEFAVTDIADAMILGRLFARLFELGTVVVATSNVAPNDLYRDGLNRALFLPFIDLLKANVEVFELAARTDYRSERDDLGEVFFSSPGPTADRRMEMLWQRLAAGPGEPAAIPYHGRFIHIPRATQRAARFDFADICGVALAAGDYLQIAARYRIVFIEHIPVMGFERRNEAKRFINLVDTLYDHHAVLIASADAEPDKLYWGETGAESFEFQRTASRLKEMRSREYLAPKQDLAEHLETLAAMVS
ncbi:MAG: cell division protein ZapE [Ancalomicrobiaceae bacterium]|nr:cell division protein ZapE [Ancalomicrobiaceae bacterium]